MVNNKDMLTTNVCRESASHVKDGIYSAFDCTYHRKVKGQTLIVEVVNGKKWVPDPTKNENHRVKRDLKILDDKT
ncbi:hypothetical protein F444_06079, partial [Phytophthora nicotianae P1976]